MTFEETELKGAFVVGLKKIEDDRGFFARGWCQKEFADAGLNPNLVQINLAVSLKAGTLRGMHFQAAPHAEAKLVRCTRGADLRRDGRPAAGVAHATGSGSGSSSRPTTTRCSTCPRALPTATRP